MKNQFTSPLQASSLESRKFLKITRKTEHYLKNNDIIQKIK